MKFTKVSISTPLETAMSRSGKIFFEYRKDIQGLLQVLIDAGGNELLIQDYRILGEYFGPTESLSYLVGESLPAYQNLTSYDLYYVATSVGKSHWPNDLELVQLILSSIRLDEALKMRGAQGRSLLHVCVDHCIGNYRKPIITASSDPWRMFTRELISAGVETSLLDENGRSPLSWLLHENLLGTTLNQRLGDWLWDLNEAGVDLRRYGEIESAVNLSFECHCHSDPKFRPEGRHVISFSYGPSVDDWQFWVDEPTDVFAGTFWKMVEQTAMWEELSRVPSLGLKIPGSWLENEDEDEVEVEVEND